MALRIGGPVFVQTQDPDELAKAHVSAGFNAAYCPSVPLEDAAALRKTREAFARHDVMLAEVGAWGNLMAPDTAKRERNLQYACRQLTLADELGAPCCVTYLGTVGGDSDFGPDPRNLTAQTFDAAVEVIRKVVDTARPKHAKFCLEMMQWLIPDSVECYARLLKAVDRKGFGVHADPVNIVLTPRQAYDTGTLLRELFRTLGEHVTSCHAKDIVIHNQLALHLDEIRPGLGLMDYHTFIEEVAKLGRPVALMLEHLPSADDYEIARRYIVSKA
jgi:sugar phosphate isomerase/epimerase